MWTITYKRNNREYTASFTSTGDFQTNSPSLEAMYLIKLDNPPILQATATGPSAELDLTSAYLLYAYVAGILFNDLDVKTWNIVGDYLWPLDSTPASTVFKYVDLLRQKLGATPGIETEFYNKCHSAEDGTFCKTPGAPGHKGHTTAAQAEADAAAQAEDAYRGGHQPPSDAPTIDNLVGPDSFFPDDVYDNPQYYDHTGGESLADREAAAVLRKAKGKPNVKIKVYRAAPPEANSINKGDWVTTSPAYARQHAESQAGEPWPVFEIEVPANQIRNGGNDIVEWGYWGEDKPAKSLRASSEDFHLLGQHDQSTHGNRAGVGAGANSEVVSRHPSLSGLGNNLIIKGDITPAVEKHLTELAKIPQHVHERIAAAGVKVIVGEGTIGVLSDKLGGWAYTTPRGWPQGYTYSDLPAVYDDDNNEVILGTGGTELGGNPAVHEYGHAVDDVYRYAPNLGLRSQSANWKSVWRDSYDSLNNEYFQQGRTDAGSSEFFAESFHLHITNPNSFAELGLSSGQATRVNEFFELLLKPKEGE